jgi:hypothetical protein
MTSEISHAFPTTLVPSGAEDGSKVHAHVLTCHLCGKSDNIRSSNSKPLPEEVVRRKFQQKDWIVGKNDKRKLDTCPACIAAAKDNGVIDTVPEPEETMPMTAPRPDPSRSDRRKIRDALDEHYIEDKGYAKDMTDAKLADRLNVPRIWVEEMRVMLYGDETTNEEAEQIKAEMAKIKKALVEAETEAYKVLTTLDDKIKSLQQRMSKLETKV